MPGSRCSKSVSLSTLSVPPRFPPVSGSLSGLAKPAVLNAPVPATLLELEPQAASASPKRTASAAAATALIDLIERLLCVVLCPQRALNRASSGTPRVQGVSQPVAQQVERQPRHQPRDAGKDHEPPRGVEDRRGLRDHPAPAG